MKRAFYVYVPFCFILLTILLTANLQMAFPSEQIALEEVVVTATRTKESLERVSNSVTVITSQQIQAQHANNVLEVLRNVPGVYISRTGTLGKTTSAFLRGSESKHTLLMIDGVQINSPTLGSADLADLTVDNIDRIEIVRGSQSTLYGSDAIAGVINIITKTGSEKAKYDLSVEAGSFKTFTEKAALSGIAGKLGYAIALSRTNTSGLDNLEVPVYSRSGESAIVDRWVNKKYGNDEYNNTALSGRLSYPITQQINSQFTFRLHSAETGVPGPLLLNREGKIAKDYDKNASQSKFGGIFLAEFDQQLRKGWEHKIKASLVKDTLKFDDPLDPGQDPKKAFVNKSKIDTDISTVDWQHTIRLNQIADLPESVENTSVAGIELERQTASNFDELQKQSQFDESINNIAGYAQDQVGLWNRFFITAGIRGDRHATFGTSVNPKISASYILRETKTKLRGSWGTGFRAPTFNDLYFPGYGNKDVKPEENNSFEAGIEQKLFKDRVHIGTTYFQNKFKNLIAFKIVDPKTFFGYADNIKKAESKGWEFEGSLKTFEGVTILGSYTFLDAKDTSDKNDIQPLRRRPKHSSRLNLNYEPAFNPLSNKLNLNLNIVAVGKRPEVDSESQKREVIQYPGYTKVDLVASVKILDSIRAFAKASNLLDFDYQEVIGYPSYGAHFTGGIMAKF